MTRTEPNRAPRAAADHGAELDRIRRSVALLAEVVDDALGAIQQHIHAGEWAAVDHKSRLALDRALGKLDAVRSALGVGGIDRGAEADVRLREDTP